MSQPICIIVWIVVLLLFTVNAQTAAQSVLRPVIEWTLCPFDLPPDEIRGETVVCGRLLTAEDHSGADSPTIQIAFAVLISPTPTAEPLIFLEGGPGISALAGVERWWQSPLRASRDIILFDQRGAGFSEPNLNCIELEAAPLTDALAAVQACYDRLLADGIALTAYNSAQSAADLLDLRGELAKARDYTAYHLLGISYGTRLALTVLRDSPTGIRSAVLDSTLPPQIDLYNEIGRVGLNALNTLIESCEADATCNAAYPNLGAVLINTVERLNIEPAIFVADGAQNPPIEFVMTGDDFVGVVIGALYQTHQIPLLPRLIYAVWREDYSGVAPTLRGELFAAPTDGAEFGDRTESEGLMLSVQCHEEIPFNDLTAARLDATSFPAALRQNLLSVAETWFADCTIWQVGAPDPSEDQPVRSDSPVLILAGQYDPVTPPEWGRLAAETLPNSTFLTFRGVGHSVIDSGPCPVQIVTAFLAAPDDPVDAACAAELAAPVFVTP
ncbi:MAG: alpha/beta hydrolase [Chloroflexi bacterium]|nr:alpha/beta hydrolase [Chloroflexota bacterium]